MNCTDLNLFPPPQAGETRKSSVRFPTALELQKLPFELIHDKIIKKQEGSNAGDDGLKK